MHVLTLPRSHTQSCASEMHRFRAAAFPHPECGPRCPSDWPSIAQQTVVLGRRGRVPGEWEREWETRKDKKKDSEWGSIKMTLKYPPLTVWSAVLPQTPSSPSFYLYFYYRSFLFSSSSLFSTVYLFFLLSPPLPPVFGQLWVRIGLRVALALPLWWQNGVCGFMCKCVFGCHFCHAYTWYNNNYSISDTIFTDRYRHIEYQ